MSYKQIAAEFFYGCFRAGLSVELLICKMFQDLFGSIAAKFEGLCIEGMKQMTRLRAEPSTTSPPEDAQEWMREIDARVGRFPVA